jgi:hypothetical protein
LLPFQGIGEEVVEYQELDEVGLGYQVDVTESETVLGVIDPIDKTESVV